ncbi:MAG: hypothetical protein KDA84_26050, partial [Planctomycetaceae bacterium]|nr:hypothetical protein [Planctomycetaceae bacterium]
MRSGPSKTLQIILLLFICISSRSGWGADPSDQTPEKRKAWVTEQIQTLNANSLRERFQAEKELLKAGPEVLPFLPAPELLPNAAVRQAVRRVRLKLEEAKARASVKASRVTINQTAALSDLLNEITKQTGNTLDVSELPAKLLNESLKLEATNLPFWDAMDLLASKGRFRLESRADAGAEKSALHLLPADPSDSIQTVQNVGAFRIEVAPPKFRPRFGDPDHQLLRIPLSLATEPRLQPLFLKLVGKDFLARTKEGQVLI